MTGSIAVAFLAVKCFINLAIQLLSFRPSPLSKYTHAATHTLKFAAAPGKQRQK